MGLYCLIHSSGQGPDGWQLVVEQLEMRGHNVMTPGLVVKHADQGLAYHAGTLVDALDRSGFPSREVICVAHSASGMFLPLVAAQRPLRLMVFLAALVPRPGLSVLEQAQGRPFDVQPELGGPGSEARGCRS